jgi:predicted NAD-dependent protein-ADP-ribosyltransferase YbiA (DUF1768 family)
MKRALCYKFSQNPDLLKKLIDTGDAKLVEASDRDAYWGGILPDSKNKLGLFLEELRENYRNSNQVFLKDCDFEPLEVIIN